MNKLNDSFSIDNGAVSLDALKSVDKGDMVLFMGDSGELSLFTVLDKVTTRGRKGGTALTLQDFVSESILDLPTTNALPDGVMMVRKVLKGVNARTLRKVVPTDATSITSEVVEVAPEVVIEPAALQPTEVPDPVSACAPLSDNVTELLAEIVQG